MTPEILTRSGQYFDFVNPEKSNFNIEDIAHALSNICRFTGHTREFYSVAQHSVFCSHVVPPKYALAALLHDAAEAFLGDVSSPLKHLLPDYKAIEKRVERAVFTRFGLSPDLPACVKEADLILLATERRDLMPWSEAVEWPILRGVEPLQQRIAPLPSFFARETFLNRFSLLTGGAK